MMLGSQQVAQRALQHVKACRLFTSVNTPFSATTLSADSKSNGPDKQASAGSESSAKRKMSALELQHLRRKGERITMLTAYDYPSAKHAERYTTQHSTTRE